MLLSFASALPAPLPPRSVRSVATPSLSKRGVAGREGVEVALREWSGKYHRRQWEISEIADHIEALTRQVNALRKEVNEQDAKLAFVNTQLVKQKNEELPAIKLRYEDAMKLKHELDRAVIEQRTATRALTRKRATLAQDVDRKRNELSIVRSRRDSIARKIRELDERRERVEKQKAYREKQLERGLQKLRKSQTEIIIAERDILTMKEGLDVSVYSTQGAGLSVSSRGTPHASASHARLAIPSSATTRSDEFPIPNTTPRYRSDSAPKSARLRKPPPGIIALMKTAASATLPVKNVEKPSK